MCTESEIDPLVGSELIRIRLETYSICFEFSGGDATTICICAPFRLEKNETVIATIDPERRVGDIECLWPLIGRKVAALCWEETIRLVFDNDLEIQIPKDDNPMRGEIMGGNEHGLFHEEF